MRSFARGRHFANGASATSPQVGTPAPLFVFPSNAATVGGTALTIWEPAPDGQMFLLLVPDEDATQTPFSVLLNWAAGLDKEI